MLSALQTFFAMGGYGGYIWTVYSVAFIVLLANILLPYVKYTQILRQNTKNESSS